MVKKIEIVQSQIVFEYLSNLSIRKDVFEFEENLKDYFKVPFISYAVPETFDPSVPRFESESNYGHSRIQVSPTVLNCSTVYDEKFKQNVEEIKKYLNERAAVFSKSLQKEEKKYVAFIIDLAFEMDKNILNDFIAKHTGAIAVSKETVDFILTYSFPYKEHFYVNIKTSKYISEKVVISKNNEVVKTGEFTHGVLVSIDLNTKFFFNSGGKYDPKHIVMTSDALFKMIEQNTVEGYLNGKIK